MGLFDGGGLRQLMAASYGAAFGPPEGPFYHGGVPGLSPGDKILPPRVTGTQRPMEEFLPARVTAATHPWIARAGFVYFTRDWDHAAQFAAAYPDGAVYEVQPDGEISPDPDAPGGAAWRARSATIIRVDTPLVKLPRDLAMKDLTDEAGHAAGLALRMISVLRSAAAHEVTCQRGHTHWGQFGAAGLLLCHARGEPRYLLQLRAPGTQHAGTWGLPGGALGWEEHPYVGACREAEEELGPLPELRPRVIGIDDHGGWRYSTVVADVAEPFKPSQGDGEGVAYRWCTEAEALGLSLHPGLAEGWPRLVDLLGRY